MTKIQDTAHEIALNYGKPGTPMYGMIKTDIQRVLNLRDGEVLALIDNRKRILRHSIADKADGDMEKRYGEERIDELRIFRNTINGQ